jgi:hypothetical protein
MTNNSRTSERLTTGKILSLITVTNRRQRSAPSLLGKQLRAVLALPVIFVFCAETKSQRPNSSSPPNKAAVAAISRETAQPQLALKEKAAYAVFAETSANTATAVNQPRSGSGGSSFLKRLVLFPLRVVQAFVGSFGEGSKSGTNDTRDGVGEVVDSKILDDIAVPNLPPDTPGVPVLSDSAATNESGLKSAIEFSVVSQRELGEGEQKQFDDALGLRIAVRLRLSNRGLLPIYYFALKDSVLPEGYQLFREVGTADWQSLPPRRVREKLPEVNQDEYTWLELSPGAVQEFETFDWSNVNEEHAFSTFVKSTPNAKPTEIVSSAFRPSLEPKHPVDGYEDSGTSVTAAQKVEASSFVKPTSLAFIPVNVGTAQTPLVFKTEILKNKSSLKLCLPVRATVTNAGREAVAIDTAGLRYQIEIQKFTSLPVGGSIRVMTKRGDYGPGQDNGSTYTVLPAGETYSTTVNVPLTEEFFHGKGSYKIKFTYGQFREYAFQAAKLFRGTVESNVLDFTIAPGGSKDAKADRIASCQEDFAKEDDVKVKANVRPTLLQFPSRDQSTVHIEFERAGKREPLEASDSASGIWLRLHNNSKLPIVLDMHGVPSEDYGDASLIYDVLSEGRVIIPDSCHACSFNSVGPGHSLSFSVPAEHLSLGRSIRIKFNYEGASANSTEPGLYVYFHAHEPVDSLQPYIVPAGQPAATTTKSVSTASRKPEDALLSELPVSNRSYSSPSVAFPKNIFPVVRQNYSDANRAGYVDETGKVIIDLRYYSAGNFSEDLAPVSVKRGEKTGYINQTGEVVIEPRFEAAHRFVEGLAAVRINEDWGYIDQLGRQVIDPRFEIAMDFSEGLAAVLLDGQWGFIDKTGQSRIKVGFERANAFSEGLACVVWNGKAGYINNNGEWIIKPRFEKMHSLGDQQMLASFWEGMAVIRRDDQYGFINIKGEVAIKPQFDRAERFSEGLAAITKAGLTGYIDKIGNIAIAPRFENADSFSEGLAAVKLAGKWGFIDQTGTVVIVPQFDSVMDFKNGLAQVWIWDGDTGYIDKTGKFVWQAKWRP